MWSVYLDTSPLRAETTRLLSRFSRRAFYGPLAPLRLRSLPRAPLPGASWVRVRNAMAGIRGSDLQQVQLQSDPGVAPLAAPKQRRVYLGSEVAGEVIEVGPAVRFVRPGDRVVLQSEQRCATREIEPPCRQCALGNYGLCENRYLPGTQATGAGWSEEMVVHEQQLFLVPDGLADEQAALIEPVAVGLHAALRRLPQPGDNVLVIGAGTVGLLTMQAIQALGPEGVSITALARHPFQVEMAARMGAAQCLYDEDLAAAVARLTGARRFQGARGAELFTGGFDIVYDAVGTAATLQSALRWTRAGGAVVLVGSRLAPLRLDLTPLWHQEVELIGAAGHGTEQLPAAQSPAVSGPGAASGAGPATGPGTRLSTFQLAARLIREHVMTPERLITHRFPLREVRQALATARDRRTHRAITVLLDMRDPAGIERHGMSLGNGAAAR
jgi:threonine dehydrogenase-like Zn-dependent dehydrogenase